ncbi:MAG: sulfur transferase domain-containing protein, partial [Xanthomonadales bacterium]|nr:sulfur transferase domain-containing protein [Xanthomonadales bacterium]
MSRVKVLLSLLLLLGLGANAKGAESPQTALADLPHVSFPAAHRVASGALHASDMAALKQAGVKDVINLRTPAETPAFDEAEAMARAGIEYHSLPIHGAQGLTQDNVRRFDQLLHASGDQLTLVHCASSNRVGAMVALRAGLLQGKTVEQAIAEGQRWG